MSEKTKHWIVFVVSLASSVGGFLFFVLVSPSPENASRGGDLAMAITLGFLFVSRNYGSRYFAALTKRSPAILAEIQNMRDGKSSTDAPLPEPTCKELERRIKILAQSIEIDKQGHDTENSFLAGATVVATLVSGFGDVAAKHLIEFLK